MSPRAAWRLESWGYDAYDYVAGKMDWLSFDLPKEGNAVLAGDAVTRDVPTCTPEEPPDTVREHLEGNGLARLPVVNDDRIVIGSVDEKALDSGAGTIDDVLSEGPTTVRPSEELEGLLHRMEHARVPAIFVTASDGRLVGILDRDRGRQHLDERG